MEAKSWRLIIDNNISKITLVRYSYKFNKDSGQMSREIWGHYFEYGTD